MDLEITTVYYTAMLIFGFAGFVKTVLEIREMLHRHSESRDK
jgi:hypothetical protein